MRNPIDAFVLAKLEEKGLATGARGRAARLAAARDLDLTGLPPTLAEQDAFLRNPTPEAMDAVVKDLLARPTYGERWGRHWLDVVRYAETDGYERDAAKPSVWRYRDYVIKAFNDDKPYDRFLLEQLAGDELPDANAETLIATGFNRLGPWDDEPADPKEDRFDQLDDIVNATSLVFLGTDAGCARCHDHKFEALTHARLLPHGRDLRSAGAAARRAAPSSICRSARAPRSTGKRSAIGKIAALDEGRAEG